MHPASCALPPLPPAVHLGAWGRKAVNRMQTLQFYTYRLHGLTLFTADDYNRLTLSKVLSTRGGAGQRVGYSLYKNRPAGLFTQNHLHTDTVTRVTSRDTTADGDTHQRHTQVCGIRHIIYSAGSAHTHCVSTDHARRPRSPSGLA